MSSGLTVESRLKAVQSHFTWDLKSSRSKLLRLRDKMIDICPDDGNVWLGHIYNLQGFLQYKLGLTADALSLFTRATEAFRRIGSTSEGPWLLVNYGDLAWLHHELGQQEDTETYLSQIQALTQGHPAVEDDLHPEVPTEKEQHPEVLAEKAWTMMKFGKDQKLLAAELFEKALAVQPERAEWHSSQVVALVSAHKHRTTGVGKDILKNMKKALELDPENLFLAAEYLTQRANLKESVEDEATDLTKKILENPVSSYNGFKSILKFYRFHGSVDEAIFWAEEAVENHPESRYLKRCLALCYKWRIVFKKDGAKNQSLIKKAVSLQKEVIALYPDTCLVKELDLADLYGKSDRSKATEIYRELLERDMEPEERQMFYNRYAKHLQFDLRDIPKCLNYHYKAALIDHDSFFRKNSVKAIETLKAKEWKTICDEMKRSSRNLKLEALQCHFTWELDGSRATYYSHTDRLTDTCSSHTDRLTDMYTQDHNIYEGYSYNLQGFLQYELGRSADALSLFTRATEAFRRIRSASEGPWLLVNYGDLAWLHYKLGQQEDTETYLSKIQALTQGHPAAEDIAEDKQHSEVLVEKEQHPEVLVEKEQHPEVLVEKEQHPEVLVEKEQHPEVLVEKAWTMMEFTDDRKHLATKFLEKALAEQPDRVEWRSLQAMALLYAHNGDKTAIADDIFDKMKLAQQQDPENVQLSAVVLKQRVKEGEDVKMEAAELASKVLDRSRISDIKVVLELLKTAESVDAALDLAEKILEKHPEDRYLKKCVAMCYKWKLCSDKDNVSQDLIDKAIVLFQEVISLYPHSSLKTQIELADVCAKSNHNVAQAKQIYQELLQRDLERSSAQMLYNHYANFLFFEMRDRDTSVQYHLKAAQIPTNSYFRNNSIALLRKIRPSCRHRISKQIEEFLDKIP